MALKDFAKAKQARFTSGFGEPTWRKKFKHEGFRVIGSDRVPVSRGDGNLQLSAHGKQVVSRAVVVQKLNRRWAQVKVPGCGWVHIAFAVIPEPVEAPGTGAVIGIDRGVEITAALSDGRRLNCPQLTVKERKGSDRKAGEYAKVAKLKAREVNRRKDWCEKTSTALGPPPPAYGIQGTWQGGGRTGPLHVSAVQCLRLDREERTPTQQSMSRQDRSKDPGIQPVPEGRHGQTAGRVSVNLNSSGLESPFLKRGRMSKCSGSHAVKSTRCAGVSAGGSTGVGETGGACANSHCCDQC